MKLAVISKKGGVGKTPFAFSIAKDLNMYLQSNDNSAITQIYKDKAKINKIVDDIDNCVYDFGGFSANGVINIVKSCKYCIIPIVPSSNAIIKTFETINELKDYNNNIIILATNYRNDKEKEFLQSNIDSYFNFYPIFFFKISAIILNSMHYGASFTELYKENPLTQNSYKIFYEEYEKLLDKIKE